MALKLCPQCKQNVSDITGFCPLCNYSFQVTQLDFSKTAPKEDIPPKTETQKAMPPHKVFFTVIKSAKSPFALLLSIALFGVGIYLLIKGSVIGTILILLVSLVMWITAFTGTRRGQAQVKPLCCRKCSGTNLNISVQYEEKIVGSTSEVRKKSIVTRAANDIGRAGMIAATGGLWALTPKRSKYKEIEKFNTKSIKHKVAVCQDCGYSWEML